MNLSCKLNSELDEIRSVIFWKRKWCSTSCGSLICLVSIAYWIRVMGLFDSVDASDKDAWWWWCVTARLISSARAEARGRRASRALPWRRRRRVWSGGSGGWG
ncbi:hypothetical protein RHGRI_025026 [Rhododendron griersonianum]|uniref:Uncharacterized protein n=1 Tax=Rhododendron griersonianum TaxID=479676 RepID=A0AAV6JDQ3_9ERIC|nr:hypothetical protein RHGRI_025026 [Rhododendron griersonianum]